MLASSSRWTWTASMWRPNVARFLTWAHEYVSCAVHLEGLTRSRLSGMTVGGKADLFPCTAETIMTALSDTLGAWKYVEANQQRYCLRALVMWYRQAASRASAGLNRQCFQASHSPSSPPQGAVMHVKKGNTYTLFAGGPASTSNRPSPPATLLCIKDSQTPM